MIRKIVYIFWIVLLWGNSFGQSARVFTSIAEAETVPADSVFQLDLSKSRLDSLPSTIVKFKNLRVLYLAKNKLSSLPDNFYFAHLEILDLTKNKFTVFPEVICQNTNLQQLLMGKNELSALPECIGQLQKLVILDAWFNTVTEIPESITQLRQLRSLDLQGMNYSEEFQAYWRKKLPWVKIEFDVGCDCGH